MVKMGMIGASTCPPGVLFLTTDIHEAKCYGKYVIKCTLKEWDNITFKVNANNPSQLFDDDYGISLIQHSDRHYGFWEAFEESCKSCLIIKGTHKSTLITYTDNIIPYIQ